MTDSTRPTPRDQPAAAPPSSFKPYPGPGRARIWFGPALIRPGLFLQPEWTPAHGVVIRDENGTAVPVDDLVRYACQLLQLHDVAAHGRPVEADR